VYDFFQESRNRGLLQKLAAAGVQMADEAPSNGGAKPLAGLTLVLTGRFADYSRQQAEEALAERGATITGSVSRRTSAVIAGEEPGSKVERAADLGIPVLGEAELSRMLSGSIDADALRRKE
jgi:DNA ligase (NAD+)